MRRSIVLAFACLSSMLGCPSDEPDASASESTRESAEPAPASDPTPEPEPAGPPIGAWVAIDEQYGLFQQANAEGDRLLIQQTARIRAAEVVAIAGDYIEVRTIASDRADVCALEVVRANDYDLRLFVQPAALRRVLTRTKRAEFDDGTSLELAPGVPVIETGTPGKVRVGGANLSMDLAESDIGRWFVPSPIEPTSSPLTWKRGLQLHYGEHGFTAAADPFLDAQARTVLQDGQMLISFVNTCGRFVLRAEAGTPDATGVYTLDGPMHAIPGMPEPEPKIFGVIGQHEGRFLASPDDDDDDEFRDECSPLGWKATATAGTKLTWANGGEAGVVLATHELPRDAEERDSRVCFQASGLDVCIETTKLERATDYLCDPSELDDFPGFPPPEKFVGRVRLAEAEVGEGLDVDIVRRIVRAHINELRRCYDAGLAERPALAGTIEIAFEIAATGKVARASVKSAVLVPADDGVPACITKAFKRWQFPKPRAGKRVSVVYPLELSP